MHCGSYTQKVLLGHESVYRLSMTLCTCDPRKRGDVQTAPLMLPLPPPPNPTTALLNLNLQPVQADEGDIEAIITQHKVAVGEDPEKTLSLIGGVPSRFLSKRLRTTMSQFDDKVVMEQSDQNRFENHTSHPD
eukprot:10386357-Karenia_brevis.AAC.1